ncbi:MAG: YitT family protein [Crocinitomicaceae bacterium]|nr:YitT family protein [Crocinitomicaceae bacterium]
MEKIKKLRLKFTRDVLSGFQLLIGVVVASVGLKAFLIPNNFLDGGVTGIAILLHNITNVSTASWLIIVSVPFLALSYFFISKKIFWKSMISILALAFIVDAETFPVITDDKILIAFFGGGLIGLGIGIAIKNGSVLDSSELIGIFLNERFGVSIGRVILIFNVILFSVASYYLPSENILYSGLTFL